MPPASPRPKNLRVRIVLAAVGAPLALWVGTFWEPAVTIEEPEAREEIKTEDPPHPRPSTRHSSFLMERAFYEEAFTGGSEACPDSAKSAIVAHYLPASKLTANALSCLDPDTQVAVLLSPNHVSASGSPISMSAAVWTTPYGDLEPAVKEIEALAHSGVAQIEEAPFELEYGIGNLAAFAKRAMPRAKILPIIVMNSAHEAEISQLVEALHGILPESAAVVASLSFSRELTPVAAQFQDAKSLAVIETGDLKRLSPLAADSESVLRAALEWASRRGAADFRLRNRAASAELTGQPSDQVTTYMTGVFVSGEASRQRSATLLFAGDVMIDRLVGQRIAKHGLAWVFQPIRRVFLGSDAVIANLEGAVSDVPNEFRDRSDQPLRFVFDAALLPDLRKVGFTHFSLSNNHSNNNGGERGLAKTRTLLERAGFRHFGGITNATGAAATVEAGGVRTALVGYNAFGGGGLARALEEIRRLDPEHDVVAVMPHWGNEYQFAPSAAQRQAAHAFIEAGADVVIGAHPHVIQPAEIYKGKAIFYSLGNFVFDQTFRLDTRRGFALGVEISGREISFSFMPVQADDVQLRWLNNEERTGVLEKIASGSQADASVIEGIKKGYFALPYEPRSSSSP